MKKRTLKKFIEISYYAYQDEPFDPDAFGYVEERYLRNAFDDRFTYYGRDGELHARSGYTFVFGDGILPGERCAVIKTRHIFTEVVEEDALSGGYGMPCPTGGLTSATGYDLDGEVDGEVMHLVRYKFGV